MKLFGLLCVKLEASQSHVNAGKCRHLKSRDNSLRIVKVSGKLFFAS